MMSSNRDANSLMVFNDDGFSDSDESSGPATQNPRPNISLPTNTAPVPVPRGPRDQGIRAPIYRPLLAVDVAALIINKMVGTGIFTGPPTVLLYVENRRAAIGLWTAGFVWTIISTYLYLRYARKYPYTGGELIYLDAISLQFKYKYFRFPQLLWYTIYAVYFVLVYTTTTNALQFARQVILCATLPHSDLNSDFITDQRVWRFIAFTILSTVCLFVYFSPKQSRFWNRIFAIMKICVLFILFIAGAIQCGKRNVLDDVRPAGKDGTSQSISTSATAVLTALFGYQGWENATLVAGEVKDYKAFKIGFLSGVGIVGSLYVLIAIVYSCGVPWTEDGGLDIEFAPTLFPSDTEAGVNAARLAWGIITALSAVGSMLSVTYTCCRVKQGIAWVNILPWSRIWRLSDQSEVATRGSDDNANRNRRNTDDVRFSLKKGKLESPKGGIILHWIVSTAYIAVSASIRDPLEAAGFSGRLLSYGQVVIGVILFAAYWKVATVDTYRDEVEPLQWNSSVQSETNGSSQRTRQNGMIRVTGLKYILSCGGCGIGITLCVLSALPDGSNRQVPAFSFPAVIFSILLIATIYWALITLPKSYNVPYLGRVTFDQRKHGISNGATSAHDGRRCDLCPHVTLQGNEHRHARYGYLTYLDVSCSEAKNEVELETLHTRQP